MKLIDTTDAGLFRFEKDNGKRFEFTYTEARIIAESLLLQNLKEDIAYNIEQMDGDEIDLNNLDGITKEEFYEEVFENLRGNIEDNLTYPTNEGIYEVIGDTFDDYEKK